MKIVLLITVLFTLAFFTFFNACTAQQSPYTQLQEYDDSVRPRDTDVLIPEMSEAVELWLFVEDYRFVTGKMIHLTLQAVWKLGVSVDMERFKEVDLSPFKIEKVTVSERQIFNNDSDFCVVTYIISLPEDKEVGVYTIPSFSIPYQDEVNKSSGQVQTSSMTLKKVPILVETELDRDVIDIGDMLKYKLTIWHEKYIGIIDENMEQFNLNPFKVVDFRINKEIEGKLIKTTIEYDISIYELPDKSENFEIPSLPVLYSIDSKERLDPEEGGNVSATHKIKVPAIPVLINSLLKRIDVPLESIKGPLVYSQKDICLKSHLPVIVGTIIIVVLGANEIRKFVYKMSDAIKQKMALSPFARADILEKLLSGLKRDVGDDNLRRSIVGIDCASRAFMGALVDLPGEAVRSMTSAELIDIIKVKKLAAGIVEPAEKALKSFDYVIFGDIDKEVIENAICEVREILKEARRHGYC